MWTKYLLLLLLPAVAYSAISVKIKPGKTAEDSVVGYSGEDKAVVSKKERKTFGITDEALKNASEKYEGKGCSDVYVKPPTPWGNVYDKYNWDVVMRTLKPVRARVLSITAKRVTVDTKEYINHHNSKSVTYSMSVTPQVEETVDHTWSSGGELSIGQEINYNVNFGAGSVGGTTSLSYTSNWGTDRTESRTITLGTASHVSTTVPPGGTVEALLTATQGTMDIEVDYTATISGDVFCNYDPTYKGHHFYALPLKRLQKLKKLPITVKSTEKISVGFYTNARIEINNGTTHKEIQEKPAGIIKVQFCTLKIF